ncbi:MAG TPA: hypothetical protein VFH27_14800 [Longimicrobiaceae bacterium]|nr:hypothetical protein [Longimicrobiaceae bacterium]
MPLVVCPDCLKDISDAAPSCIHCGRPAGTVQVYAPHAQIVAPPMMSAPAPSALACPNCGSENTVKLSVLWRDGVQSVNTRTSGVGLAGGGLGVGTARTTGTAQTMSSVGAAPPAPPAGNGGLWFMALFGMAMAGAVAHSLLPPEPEWLGTLAFVVVAGLLGYWWFPILSERDRRQAAEHRERVASWERTYRCNRCEHRYLAAEPSGSR